MGRAAEQPVWNGQRPWLEMWFAVLLDVSKRRGLWVRQTFFIPREGEGRATTWGAWFDADAARPARAAKRFTSIDRAKIGEGETLIQIDDSYLTKQRAKGSVEGLAWDIEWEGGRQPHAEVPSWLPAPTHVAPLAYDAIGGGKVVVDGTELDLRGHVTATHFWGKRRVPTMQWLWAPWMGDASLEVSAISMRDTFSLGLAMLRLDGKDPASTIAGRPATSAYSSCVVSATVAGPRRLVHARAWAEPEQMVGYAYRDTDDRDVMVAQSDIASAHFEVYTRKAPGAPWHLTDERRSAGGAAVKIHQHARLPGVAYLPWDGHVLPPPPEPDAPPFADTVEWPEVRSVVALGLTYGDHGRETGRKLSPGEPPTSFTKDHRAFARGERTVRLPTSDELLAALEAIEPGLAIQARAKLPIVPPIMDYEGEIALVALGPIDDARLGAGTPQPLGLAAANDLTARICQVFGETMADPLAYWTCAKSFPGFLPVAPRVWAPPTGLARMPELTLETRVNGDVRQHASTKLLVYDLTAIVRAARAHLGRPLDRGDVILTGTPTGVGLRMSPLKRKVASLVKDRFRKAELLVSSYATSSALLRPGDVVEVDAGPAGRVRTRIAL